MPHDSPAGDSTGEVPAAAGPGLPEAADVTIVCVSPEGDHSGEVPAAAGPVSPEAADVTIVCASPEAADVTRVPASPSQCPSGPTSPAMVPVRNVAREPARMDLRPRRARSLRRSGTMPPRPPSTTASEPKLAKPHSAKLVMRRLRGESSAA